MALGDFLANLPEAGPEEGRACLNPAGVDRSGELFLRS